MNAYLNQYQNNQVTTASSEQLLIMLYDGAIRFVSQAAEAMAGGNVAGQVKGISKAQAILTELSQTLDHEVGGEIAANLEALYNFMLRELTQANLKDDAAPLETVKGLLKELRQTWVEAIKISRANATGVQQPAAATAMVAGAL